MSFLLLEEMIVRRGPGTVVENDNRTSQASLWDGTLKTQTLRSDSLQCFGGRGGVLQIRSLKTIIGFNIEDATVFEFLFQFRSQKNENYDYRFQRPYPDAVITKRLLRA